MNPQAQVALIALGWTIATTVAGAIFAWLRAQIRADIATAIKELDGRYVLIQVCDARHPYHRPGQGDVVG